MVNSAGSGSGSGTAMEKPKQWMWMRRKLLVKNDEIKPCVRSIIDDSWEEQAFAEDTAGPLGGFMWPPRSYSCSFCGRKFRSAQALGGHMNVHRRDRARLKQQSPTPQNDANPSILDVVHEYPSRVLYNSNPAGSTFVLSSSSPSRVSSVLVPISAQENCSTTTTDDSCEDQEKGSLLSLKLSSTITTTTTTTTTTSSSDSSKLEIKEKNSSSKTVYEETAAGGLVLVQNTKEIIKFDSDVSLNLAMLRPYRPNVSADSSSSDDQEIVHIGCKRQRRRTDHVALSLALSVKSTHHSLDKCDDIHFQNFPSPIDQKLDLELRLGNQPN